METRKRPRILCVDDEPQVLEGLELTLRRFFDFEKATSGAEGLATLARVSDIAVIVADMRMPGMDGVTFLACARAAAPDTVRILLTGQTEMTSAINAVNEGQIFRFLTKPCSPSVLLAAVTAAVEQHRLITAERVLLEETLHGSIKALTDVLALVSPTSFGRATRIKQLVVEIAERLELREVWQVDVAAMLSQLGFITLPPELAERVYYGAPLTPEEQKVVSHLPAVTEELLGNIPRLEEVREILRTYTRQHRFEPILLADPKARVVAQGTQLLRLAVDFDALDSAGDAVTGEVVETLRGRTGAYNPMMLEALAELRGTSNASQVRELPVRLLRPGMIVAEDVKMRNGALLVARGYEITERFLERVRNFSPDTVMKPTWRVIIHEARLDRREHEVA